jgi:hypothetical protein
MAEYFLVLDAAQFEGRTRPALAEAWHRRRFDAARKLCEALLPAARDYAERYHTGSAEPLLAGIAAGRVPFDRALWRTLVGEVLLFSALEIPEFQVNGDTLTCLLAPQHYREDIRDRSRLAPVQQALTGTRDLTFGAAIYRPDHAGLNTTDDVKRLAKELAAVRPETWSVADLAGLRAVPVEDLADELAFAQEWFPVLVNLYERTASTNRIIVHESIF